MENEMKLMSGVFTDHCPSCKGNDVVSLGKVPIAFHFGAVEFAHPINESSLFQCNTCHLYYKNPCLGIKEIDHLYTIQPLSTWQNSGTILRYDFKQLIDYIVNSKNILKEKILDVGCFDGTFLLNLMSQLDNNENRYYGLEPSTAASKNAVNHGVKIIGKFLKDIEEYKEYFDLIILIDVFEHILDSQELLLSLNKILRPGGSIIISTGAADSVIFQKYLSQYYYTAMPEHLSFISKFHISFLAEKNNLLVENYNLINHNLNRPSIFIRTKLFFKNIAFNIFKKIPPSFFFGKMLYLIKIRKIAGYGVSNWKSETDHCIAHLKKI